MNQGTIKVEKNDGGRETKLEFTFIRRYVCLWGPATVHLEIRRFLLAKSYTVLSVALNPLISILQCEKSLCRVVEV